MAISSKLMLAFPILILCAGIITNLTTPYMGIASFNYLLIVTGLLYKSQPRIHSKLMATAIISDVLLVLVIELQRSAIHTAAAFSLNTYQQLHILTATIAVILYFPTFILGYRRLNGRGIDYRKKHLVYAVSAFVFRTISFVLMFSLLDHVRA